MPYISYTLYRLFSLPPSLRNRVTLQPLVAVVPNIRYPKEKATVAGPGKKMRIHQLFLREIVAEIKALQTLGCIVNTPTGETETVFPMVVSVVNDTRAVPYGMLNKQPPALKQSCVHCYAQGKTFPGTNSVYVNARQMMNDNDDMSEGQQKILDTHLLSFGVSEELKTIREQMPGQLGVKTNTTSRGAMGHVRKNALLNQHDDANRIRIENRMGFKGSSCLLSLFEGAGDDEPGIVSVTFVDMAHNMASVVKQVLVIVSSGVSRQWLLNEIIRRKLAVGVKPPLEVSGKTWKAHRSNLELVYDLLRLIRIPCDTQLAHIKIFDANLKIAECLSLVKFRVLEFLLLQIKSIDPNVRSTLIELLNTMVPMLNPTISKEDLPRYHLNMVHALIKIETYMPMRFCTSVLHSLYHVYQPVHGYIARLGPIMYTWMLPSERFNSFSARLVHSYNNIALTMIKKYQVALFIEFAFGAKEALKKR